MKKFICLLLMSSFLYSGQKPAVTPATQIKTTPTAAPTTLNNHEALSAFAAIDFPLSDITDAFTVNIFKTIETVFAKSSYPLDTYQISTIKKAYLYLIFLAKIEKVKTVAALKQYQTDFSQFLSDNNTQLPHLPSQKLVTSAGWSAVTITGQDLINSQAWQLFCKSMVCDVYVYYAVVLQMIHNVEKQTFNYIPHIETSFYNADYTSLRTINEMTRVKLILENEVKKYFLNQCPAWNALSAQAQQKTPLPKGTKPQDPLALEKEIVAFRQIPFYKMSHDKIKHYTKLSTCSGNQTCKPFKGTSMVLFNALRSSWATHIAHERTKPARAPYDMVKHRSSGQRVPLQAKRFCFA